MSGKGSPVEKYGYDAVIPADVLFNKDLSDRAKILYALLRNLSYQTGYAFARNERLQEFFGGCSEATISRLLKQLVDAKAIRIEGGDGGRQIRKIFVGEVYLHNLRKNEEVNPLKNEEVTNNSIKNNKKGKKKTAAVTKDVILEWLDRWAVGLNWANPADEGRVQGLVNELHAFVDMRFAKGRDMLTLRTASLLAGKLVSNSDGYYDKVPAMRFMLMKAIDKGWDSVWPIKQENQDEYQDFLKREYGIVPEAPKAQEYGDGDAGWL